MEYTNFTDFKLSDPTVINNKDGNPIWDMYTLEMTWVSGLVQKVRLVTEHNGINLKDTSKEEQKFFFIERLFGENGLFKKQDRRDFIFLGRLDYVDGKYKPERFYKPPYSGSLSAQEYFDANYHVLEEELNQQDNLEKEKERIGKIRERLKKYGFTMDEYEALMRNQGSDHFISTTLLHEFDILKITRIGVSDPLAAIDFWTDFNNVIKFYENVYSAMCKFALIYKQDISAHRQCSNLFKREMEVTGKTASLLSFRPISQTLGGYPKPDEITLKGTIRKGTPCFDYSIFEKDDWSPCSSVLTEILIPPFMNIKYKPKGYNSGRWIVYIDYQMSQEFTQEDANKMDMLEAQIKDMSVVRNYYEYWWGYITKCNLIPNDKLRQEFSVWQINFKKYLQLKYKQIEAEVMRNHNATIHPGAISTTTKGITPKDAINALSAIIGKLRGTKNGPKL